MPLSHFHQFDQVLFNKQVQLNPKFSSKVDSLVQQILQKVTPKKAFNGVTTVNGKALTALAGGYVEAVNRPGALYTRPGPGLAGCGEAGAEGSSYGLVREYEREIEEALEKPTRCLDHWTIDRSNQTQLDASRAQPRCCRRVCGVKKYQDGEWKEVARTKKTKALVKGLKWMTTHEFQVMATNSTVTSISSGETSESIFPSSLVSSAGVGAGAATSLFLPYAIGASCEAFKQNKSYGGESQLTQFQSDV